MKPFRNLSELIRYFDTEDKAREYVESLIWKGKPVCPHCASEKLYKFKNSELYKCANNKCYKKFTVRYGTIFENSNIKFTTWLAALYLTTSHKKGVSSHQLGKDLGVTQKTAWFMLSRIRKMLEQDAPQYLSGEIECDETYIGGRQGNKHIAEQKRINKGTGYVNKVPVFGMLQRDGKVVTKVLTEANGSTLKPIIREMLSKDSTLITDGFGGYSNLGKEYNHVIINHEKGQFVNGNFHTNSLEGFWGFMKRGIYGIYHHASKQHLHRYTNEFAFRYNTRKMAEVERLEYAVTLSNVRLPYKELIKRV